jgi:hypothetical protein
MKGLLLISVIGIASLAAGSQAVKVWDFEKAEVGKLPKGWSAAKTGKGPGSVWKVLEDKSAPAGPKVLVQTSSAGPRSLFNLCVADATQYTDLDLTVALKALGGKIDQGGGPAWRYRDEDNYYVARLNPLEANYRVYKVVKGKRTELASADLQKKESLAGQWHTIRIIQRGGRIRCCLDGKLRLELKDDTFRGAGKVGLWTKADAVTAFDKLSVAAVAPAASR